MTTGVRKKCKHVLPYRYHLPVIKVQGNGRTCNVCEHLVETTRATSCCPECEMALCDRCTKAHLVSPASRDHEVCDLSAEAKVSLQQKVTCHEHKENFMEFHCKDCKKSACQRCCSIYHSACKDVATIESMRQEMTSNLNMKRSAMSKTLETKTVAITTKRTAIHEASKTRLKIQSQIRSVSKKAIDKIKQTEKQLMDKLDEATEKQISQLQADLKLEEIEIQMYRQHCEFIDQAVNSECVMAMYDMYQVCESGVLMLDEVRNTNITDRQVIGDIRFTHDLDKYELEVAELLLGKIEVINKAETGRVLHDMIDIRTDIDQTNPRAWDVTVLTVDNVRVTVVTDGANKCMKSFYTRNRRLRHSRLPLYSTPWGITQLKENQVTAAVPESKQIVAAEVTPDLVLCSTISTNKPHHSLVVLSPLSLAAACGIYRCVDILSMSGQVRKSISRHDKVHLFSSTNFISINNKGNLFVSDCGKTSAICLTSDGNVLWQYTPKGKMSLRKPLGITATSEGDSLLADRGLQKVIQLNDKGEFIRDVLTSADGLTEVHGIVCTVKGSIIVCDDSLVKEFK